MTKKNFASMILGTIGGVLFAIGMCMTMLPEWNAFNQGVGIGAVGAVVLLITLLVRRKMEGKPMFVPLSFKTVGITLLAIIGALALGVGMCMTMLPEWNAFNQGVGIGAVGAVVLLITLLVRRKMEGKPMFVPLSFKTVGITLLAIIGALALGVGMCMTMIWNMLIFGIIVGLVGIVLLLALIPLCKGLKD